MGLDIYAYADVDLNNDLNPEGRGTINITGHEDMNRLAPLVPGLYDCCGTRLTFYVGTYSGYGEFRRQLCLMALNTEPENVWENPSLWEGHPFYEMIDFTDSDGFLGTEAAQNLAKDFADFQERANAVPDENFRELYKWFRVAFEIGEKDGLVRFS